MSIKFEDAVKELQSINIVLAGDVQAARSYGQKTPTSFALRTLIRTHFAYVEGLCYQFRRVAVVREQIDPGHYSAEDVQILKEERYQVNEKGFPKVTPDFHRTLPMILFSIRCGAWAWDASYNADTSDPGWNAMQTLVDLRNGLAHPKHITDLELTDAQIKIAIEAAAWWKRTVGEMLDACYLASQANRPQSN